MNLGWPTFLITAVSHLICSKPKIKGMAEMEDQNISEIKPVLSHPSSTRIPQLTFSSHCCSYIYCWVTTLICSGSAFTAIFLNGCRKQETPSPTSETTPSQPIRVPTRTPFISYKMRQNKVAQTNQKMK